MVGHASHIHFIVQGRGSKWNGPLASHMTSIRSDRSLPIPYSCVRIVIGFDFFRVCAYWNGVTLSAVSYSVCGCYSAEPPPRAASRMSARLIVLQSLLLCCLFQSHATNHGRERTRDNLSFIHYLDVGICKNYMQHRYVCVCICMYRQIDGWISRDSNEGNVFGTLMGVNLNKRRQKGGKAQQEDKQSKAPAHNEI